MEMEYNDFIKFTYVTTYDANMKMAEFAIQNNDFEGAINFYSKAIELQQDSVVANIQKLFLLLNYFIKYTNNKITQQLMINSNPTILYLWFIH